MRRCIQVYQFLSKIQDFSDDFIKITDYVGYEFDGKFVYKKIRTVEDEEANSGEKSGEKWQRKDCLGPAIKILGEIIQESGEVGYVVSFQGKKFILENIQDNDTILRYTGVPILKPSLYKYFLAHQILWWENKGGLPQYLLVKRVKFSVEDWEYFHPAMQQDDVLYLIQSPINFNIYNIEQNLSFLRSLLREGKLAGICALASIASIFPDVQSFTVSISAPRACGKTSLARAVCRFFADIKEPVSLHATQVGTELILNIHNNMAMLLDEASLVYDDKVEKIVYMISTGKGKTRGTKRLSVRTTDIKNVVFITSENEIKLENLGAFRRVLNISFSAWSEVSSTKIEDFINQSMASCGAGIEVAKFLMKKSKDYLNNLTQKVSNSPLIWEREMWRALFLLEDFFQEEFKELRVKLEQVIQEHKEDEAMQDSWEIITNKLRLFVFERKDLFGEYRRENVGVLVHYSEFPENIRNEIKNRLGEEKILLDPCFVLLTARGLTEFESFCKINKKTIIKECLERDLLLRNKKSKGKLRKEFKYKGIEFYFMVIPINDRLTKYNIDVQDVEDEKLIEKIVQLITEYEENYKNWFKEIKLKINNKLIMIEDWIPTLLNCPDIINCINGVLVELEKAKQNEEKAITIDISSYYIKEEELPF